MRVGAYQKGITPYLPIQMAGYMDREGPATGIESSLNVRAIVVESGDVRLVLVSIDTLYITARLADEIKQHINRDTGIDKGYIFISATHTHSAPTIYCSPLFGDKDMIYTGWLKGIVCETVVLASQSLMDCKLSYGQTINVGIGDSRRDKDSEANTALSVICFKDDKENIMASIIGYNCHPTILSSGNNRISSEYPGVLIDGMNAIYGDQATFMFINGASGDVSTRFTRKNQSCVEKDRLGRLLLADTIRIFENIVPSKSETIEVIHTQIRPDLKDIPDKVEIDRKIQLCKDRIMDMNNSAVHSSEIRGLETELQGLEIQKLFSLYNDMELEGTVSVIRLGDIHIVALPLELFSSLGRDITDYSMAKMTMISGYTNGMLGYILDSKSQNRGGYEALSCRFKVGTGEYIVDSVKGLIDSISD